MTEEEIKKLLEENESLKKETTSMRSKMDELLGEAKSAKEERKAAEEAARKAEEEAAIKSGDFEKMHQASEEQRRALQADLDGLRTSIAKEKQTSTALKIANEIAEGVNADLLSSFIAPRLQYNGESIKILDENGQETALNTGDLASEFKNNARFAALIKGNQSTGGSAPGGDTGGGAANKTLNRSEFDSMEPAKQMAFIKSGGTTVD
jgi:hypothetical protein